MNIKMVVCSICHKEVTRASTLSLKELGGGEGRARRTHDEVKALIEKRNRDWENNRILERADSAMKIVAAVSCIRVFHTTRGIPLDVMYSQFWASSRFTPEEMEEIRKGVETRGAVMSRDEILFGLASVISPYSPRNPS